VSWLEAVVLGLIQGLTEFLPVSSSAHLAIYPQLWGANDPGASFTAVTQIGTELAVLAFFWRDIWRIGSTWVRSLFRPDLRGNFDARMGWYITVGTIPIAVVGVLLESVIQTAFRNLWLIAVNLIVFGLILGLADRIGGKDRPLDQLNLPDAVYYGLAQTLALMPGVSRSGSTLSLGLFRGYTREAATRYAFLLAIPAVVASGLFQVPDISSSAQPGMGKTVVAAAVAFVVGYFVIGWLLRYIRTHTYAFFVWYRLALGSVVLLLLATGVLHSHVTA
jgi:undecaprenyl-diphosphatase